MNFDEPPNMDVQWYHRCPAWGKLAGAPALVVGGPEGVDFAPRPCRHLFHREAWSRMGNPPSPYVRLLPHSAT